MFIGSFSRFNLPDSGQSRVHGRKYVINVRKTSDEDAITDTCNHVTANGDESKDLLHKTNVNVKYSNTVALLRCHHTL